MNFEGSREFFFQPPPAPSDGGAKSSAGEFAAAAAINLLTPQSIMGLSLVQKYYHKWKNTAPPCRGGLWT